MFRQELRTAISGLHTQRDQLLHAIYASPILDPCDTENILLYNVGPSYFSEAARYGLRFERAFHIETGCPCVLANQLFLHYHDYRIASFDSNPNYWKIGRTLASWSFITDAQAIKSCASIWYAIKGRITQFHNDYVIPQQYGLRLQLNVPAERRVQLAEVIKPLFDGVISALHYHDGDDNDELSRRVAAKLSVPAKEIRVLLQSKTASILGKRRLLHRFRDNVQWNPQDDTCFWGELLLQESNQPVWTVTGEIVEISTG